MIGAMIGITRGGEQGAGGMSQDEQQPGWGQHTLQQPGRDQRQVVALLALMVIVVILIGALYLIQTTTTTTTVRQLQQMGDRRARLERENERLRAEIAESESLPRLMTRAAELGFHAAGDDDIDYVVVEGYRYDRPQSTPAPAPPPAAPTQVYDETLSGWFQKQWDGLRQQFDEWQNE